MCTASANEDAESDDDDDGIQRWRPVNAVPRIFFAGLLLADEPALRIAARLSVH